MTQTNQRHWLALNLCNPVLGARRAHQLIKHFGSIEAVFAAGESALQALGLSTRAIAGIIAPDWAAVEAAQAWADSPGRHIVRYGDGDYPPLLLQIPDPPLLLYCEGDLAQLQRPALAIVGSRAPTPVGVETAQAFAAQLARLGFVIVSGMALGIDAAAHRGCLSVGGNTIAVVGTGLDRIYPARHAALAEKIRAQGVLISEFPLGTPPLGRHFPLRNRIISGLSRGVLVVEAGVQSGSLITAHQALEQGREVFAIPGSIHNPNSKGCHHLLREGAKLVDTVSNILEELDGQITLSAEMLDEIEPDTPSLPGKEFEELLAAVDTTPTSVEHIVERCGLTPDAVCSMLLLLELQNIVQMTASGQYCRTLGRSGNERKHPRCTDVSV
ncbi:MAG: DNA-protecting protein DprA [Gammaproteobacteria bacterium]|nr:DNA-protecting protein DprA [Gammaproteobacteria bacterium]